MKGSEMAALVDRTEFAPLTPEQMMSWFKNVTLQDLQTVTHEIDQKQAGPQERAS
jgi:hypothetical protein